MINEISSKSFENIDNKNQFDPDKRMENNIFETDKASSYNPDKRIEQVKYFSTYKERLDIVPKDGWIGKKGESLCKLNDENVNKELAKYDLDGILYKDAIPDIGFKKCAIEIVSIDMTPQRYGTGGNMEKARSAIADKWNEQNKDGRTDWNAREVKQYQLDNKLVIHECANRRDCYLMPIEIHENFKHLGGCSECKKMYKELGIRKEVKFDG